MRDCKRARKNKQQAAISRASSHTCALVSMYIKPSKFLHLRLEMFIFFFVGSISSLLQILFPDLTYFVLTLPTLKSMDPNWAGSQHPKLSLDQTFYIEDILKDVWLLTSKAIS